MAIDSRLIQVRRGKDAEIENEKQKLASGEPAVTTDTQRLFWGFGSGQAKEVAFKDEVEDIISNFESTVDDKIDDAVSEVTKEMEEALVAIENKKEEALEGIPEDYTELDAEVKALRKELDVSAPGIIQTSSGTEIIVTDSADKPFADFALDGKGEQMETKGYQLFDASKLPSKTAGGATVTNNGDGSFTVSGSGETTSAFNSYYRYTHEETLRLLKAGTIKMNTSNVIPGMEFQLRDSAGGNILAIIASNMELGYGNETNITQEMLDIETCVMYIYEYAGSGNIIIPGTIKPMLYQDGDGTWEPFTGGNPSPSPEYLQEIVNVGQIYNHLENTAESQTINGVTITHNPDGSITVNGTATNGVSLPIGEVKLTKGKKYKLTGCPSGGTTYTYYMYKQYDDNQYAFDTGSGVIFTEESDITKVYLIISSGTTVSNLTFYPMILSADTPNTGYRPYTGMYETEVVVRGKNLAKFTNEKNSNRSNFTYTSETAENISCVRNSAKAFFARFECDLIAGKKYMISESYHSTKHHIYIYKDKLWGNREDTFYTGSYSDSDGAVSIVFTPKETRTYIIGLYAGELEVQYDVKEFMLRPASITDNTYEPYTEQTAIIQTTEPLRASKDGAYKDRVYLDGTVERQIKEVVFDGSETGWKQYETVPTIFCVGSLDYPVIGDMKLNSYNRNAIALSNAFINVDYSDVNNKVNNSFDSYFGMRYKTLRFYHDDTTTLDDWKAFLAEQYANGTPVTVQYVLATPTTEELNAESKQALQALRTNYHNTVVTNDQDANMELDYVADTKLYIDNLIAGVSVAVLSTAEGQPLS